MNRDNIVLVINESVKVEIRLETRLFDLDCCSRGTFVLVVEGRETTLAYDTVQNNLEKTQNLVCKVLDGKLVLHESLADIGLDYNNYLEGRGEACYVMGKSGPYWVGNNYLLWSGTTPHIPVTTWLYNSQDGSIIFEVTALYPYGSSDLDEPGAITYQEWLNQYDALHTIYRHSLARQEVHEWSRKAQEALERIAFNCAQSDECLEDTR